MANTDLTVERNHYIISPSDPDQREVTEKVEKACRPTLLQQYHIRLNPGYTTTIATVYMESLVEVLVQCMRESRGNASINFLDLIYVSSDNRENDDADKDGNINIRFVPGPLVEGIMERDYCPVVEPSTWQDTIITQVQKQCYRTLSLKHKFSSPKPEFFTQITFCYLEHLFRHLKLMARQTHEEGQSMVMINFMEIFEAHCILESLTNPENPELVSEKFTVKLRPGFEAKRLIKDDNVTELDDED